MYPNGEYKFNYLNLEGDYSSATIGMQNQNNTDALTMAYNNSNAVINNNFTISVKQIPSWIEILNESGDLSNQQATSVPVTISSVGLDTGIYNGYLLIDTNVEDVTIPLILNVNDGVQIPGDINNDGLLNVQDIVLMVNNYILVDEYNSIGDINEDGYLNVLDVIILVNNIIG
tara:strand:- start:34 stop:552 length:519 start_codon:yes stop_codon:yes gene_type:complete